MRRARAQWYSVKSELERELAQEDLKRQLTEPLEALKPQMQELQQQLRDEYDGLDPGLPERVSLGESAPEPCRGRDRALPATRPKPSSSDALADVASSDATDWRRDRSRSRPATPPTGQR